MPIRNFAAFPGTNGAKLPLLRRFGAGRWWNNPCFFLRELCLEQPTGFSPKIFLIAEIGIGTSNESNSAVFDSLLDLTMREFDCCSSAATHKPSYIFGIWNQHPGWQH